MLFYRTRRLFTYCFTAIIKNILYFILFIWFIYNFFCFVYFFQFIFFFFGLVYVLLCCETVAFLCLGYWNCFDTDHTAVSTIINMLPSIPNIGNLCQITPYCAPLIPNLVAVLLVVKFLSFILSKVNSYFYTFLKFSDSCYINVGDPVPKTYFIIKTCQDFSYILGINAMIIAFIIRLNSINCQSWQISVKIFIYFCMYW